MNTAVATLDRERQMAFDRVDRVARGLPPDSGAERFRFQGVADLLATPSPPWRVRQVIPATGLVVIYGASGSGKTFTALDMAAAVAMGLPWAGRRTKAAGVAYIAAEGHLRDRVEAFLRHNGLHDIPGLRILNLAVNLLDPHADVADLIEALQALQAEIGDIGLVVIDTLNRVMPGADENSGEDMGQVIANAKRIEDACGCAVVFIHHSGKEESRGSRGHSSLKAACDAEISVRRDGDVRTVTAEKVRDGADGEVLLTFRLEVVDLGPMSDVDQDAEPEERRTSCVVAEVGTPERSQPAARLTGTDQIAFDVMKDLAAQSGETTAQTSIHPQGLRIVSIAAWRDRFRQKRGIEAGDPKALDSSRKAFQRAVDRLISLRLVGVHESRAWIW